MAVVVRAAKAAAVSKAVEHAVLREAARSEEPS
jgi:hypothetical protein